MTTLQPTPLRELSLIKLSFASSDKLQELTQVVLERDAIQHEALEDSLRAITRRFERFSLKGRALDLYTNNRIHLLGNKNTVQVPTMLPGWRVGGDKGTMAYVNVSPYLPAAGADSLDVRKLFGFLVFGEALIDSYDHWAKLSASMLIAKTGAIVYSRIMHKVADRMAGIGMDRMRSDQVKFAFAKYFLVHMLRRATNETTDSLATASTMGTANNALSDFESSIAQQANVTSQAGLYNLGFLEFVSALSKAAPWLNRITARGFIQNYTSMYGVAALLAAEDVGYFLGVLATHQAGAELISSFSFDPVYGKEGDEVLDAFALISR